MELTILWGDRQVVDARDAHVDQALLIEGPILVAVAAKPLPAIIMPFIGEAHGDGFIAKRAQFLHQPVVQLALPLKTQKGLDGLPPLNELRPVAPAAVGCVGQSHACRIAAVPCTGVNPLENDAMRLVAVFDRNSEDVKALTVIPLGGSFCQFVMRDGVFNTTHAAEDSRLTGNACRDIVASYFGLLLASGPGDFCGTLCHFHVVPNDADDAEFESLRVQFPAARGDASGLASAVRNTPRLGAGKFIFSTASRRC